MAHKHTINSLRKLIKETILESLSELSTTQASTFLNGIAKQFPGDTEKLNKYKNIIVKNQLGLKVAYAELAKELGRTPEQIERISNKKGFGKSPGNPFGKTGVNRSFNQSDEMTPNLIELSDYTDRVNELKALFLPKEDLRVLDVFFTIENFDMINSAISQIANRHNIQIGQIEQKNLVNIVDPYSNIPIIDVSEPGVVVSRGAYYQNQPTAKKAINVQDAKKKLDTALAKKTIAGLRWIITNAKLAGRQ